MISRRQKILHKIVVIGMTAIMATHIAGAAICPKAVVEAATAGNLTDQFTISRDPVFTTPSDPTISGMTISTTSYQGGVAAVCKSKFGVDFTRSFSISTYLSYNIDDVGSSFSLGFGKRSEMDNYSRYLCGSKYEFFSSYEYLFRESSYKSVGSNGSGFFSFVNGNASGSDYDRRTLYQVKSLGSAGGYDRGCYRFIGHNQAYAFVFPSGDVNMIYEVTFLKYEGSSKGTLTIRFGSQYLKYTDFDPYAIFNTTSESDISDIVFMMGIHDNSNARISLTFNSMLYTDFNPKAEQSSTKFYVKRSGQYIELGTDAVEPLEGEDIYVRTKIDNNLGKVGTDDYGMPLDSTGATYTPMEYVKVKTINNSSSETTDLSASAANYKYNYTASTLGDLTATDFTESAVSGDNGLKIKYPKHTDTNSTYFEFTYPAVVKSGGSGDETTSFNLQMGQFPFPQKTVSGLTSKLYKTIPDDYSLTFGTKIGEEQDRRAIKFTAATGNISKADILSDLIGKLGDGSGEALTVDTETGETTQTGINRDDGSEYVVSKVDYDIYKLQGDVALDSEDYALIPDDAVKLDEKTIDKSQPGAYVVKYSYYDVRTGKTVTRNRSYLILDPEKGYTIKGEKSSPVVACAYKLENKKVSIPISEVAGLTNVGLETLFGFTGYDYNNLKVAPGVNDSNVSITDEGKDNYDDLKNETMLNDHKLSFKMYGKTMETCTLSLTTSPTFVKIEKYYMQPDGSHKVTPDKIVTTDKYLSGDKEGTVINTGDTIELKYFDLAETPYAEQIMVYSLSSTTSEKAPYAETADKAGVTVKAYYEKVSTDCIIIPATIELENGQGINEDNAGKKVSVYLSESARKTDKTFTVKADTGFSIVNSNLASDLFKVHLYDGAGTGKLAADTNGVATIGTITKNNISEDVWLNVNFATKKGTHYSGTMKFYITMN